MYLVVALVHRPNDLLVALLWVAAPVFVEIFVKLLQATLQIAFLFQQIAVRGIQTGWNVASGKHTIAVSRRSSRRRRARRARWHKEVRREIGALDATAELGLLRRRRGGGVACRLTATQGANPAMAAARDVASHRALQVSGGQVADLLLQLAVACVHTFHGATLEALGNAVVLLGPVLLELEDLHAHGLAVRDHLAAAVLGAQRGTCNTGATQGRGVNQLGMIR